MTQNLVRVVEIFKSDRAYRELAELINRIPRLEQDIAEKETKLQRASEDLENARKEHTAELKRNLWLYSDEYDRFRNEKTTLEQQVKDLQAALKEKEGTISGLEKREEDLKSAGRKFEDAYKGKISKLKEKEGELAKMINEARESSTKIENLSAALKESRGQESAMKESLEKFKQRNAKLKKELDTTGRALEEIQKYSVPLEKTNATELYAYYRLWRSDC